MIDYIEYKSENTICGYYSHYLIVENDVILTEYDASAGGLVKSVAERFSADTMLDKIISDLVTKDKHHWQRVGPT